VFPLGIHAHASPRGPRTGSWRRWLSGITVVGLGLGLGFVSIGSASATSCNSTPDYTVTNNGVDTFTVKFNVGKKDLCDELVVKTASYQVPGTWDRNGFNLTAVPQQREATAEIVIPKGSPSGDYSKSVAIPKCGPYQIDANLQGHPAVLGISGTPEVLSYKMVDRPNCEVPPTEVTPGTPVVKDFCGTDNDHYGLPGGPTGVAYSRDGKDVLAEITASNTVWAQNLPAGWTKINDTHARYAFNAELFPNNDACVLSVVPLAPTSAPATCDAQGIVNPGTITIPSTDGVDYYWDGELTQAGTWEAYAASVTITAIAKTGYVLTGYSPWTFTFTAPVCVTPPTEVTATVPTVNPVCGPNNDTVTIPTKGGVNYADTGWVNGSRTITATAKDGYVLKGEFSWTFTDANVVCTVDYPKSASTDGQLTLFENPAAIAMGGIGVLGLAAFLLGIGMTRRERSTSVDTQ
jgi:hypothetical protein